MLHVACSPAPTAQTAQNSAQEITAQVVDEDGAWDPCSTSHGSIPIPW